MNYSYMAYAVATSQPDTASMSISTVMHTNNGTSSSDESKRVRSDESDEQQAGKRMRLYSQSNDCVHIDSEFKEGNGEGELKETDVDYADDSDSEPTCADAGEGTDFTENTASDNGLKHNETHSDELNKHITAASNKQCGLPCLLKLSIFVKLVNNQIIVEMHHHGGLLSKDGANQLLQYFKNNMQPSKT